MLAEMYEFDKNLVHELYRQKIEKLEQSSV